MSADNLQIKVDLSFAATDVPSYDTFSPSDPMVVVYQKIAPKNHRNLTPTLNKLGRTEPILDNANPKFSNKVRVNYLFEAVQQLHIVIYDIDDPKNVDDITKQEVIGYVDVTIGQLMSAPNGYLKLEVWKETSTTEKHKKMRLIISAREVVESRLAVQGVIRGLNIKKHGFFTQDDTSLELVKMRNDGTEDVFHMSKIVPKNNKNPSYEPFDVGLGSVFQGLDDLTTTMTIRIVRVRRNEYHSRVIIGEITKPVNDFIIESNEPNKFFDLTLSKGTNITGRIEICKFSIISQPTFTDYLQAGLTFRLFVHIDFTASNYSPPNNDLHKIGHNVSNQYQDAIRACGDCLASYTRASSIHAMGYGATVSIDGKRAETSMCFPLTLQSQKWNVADVSELLYAYSYAVKNLKLSGPTKFAPGIEKVHEICKEPYSSTFQHFNILLIITDGMICDMSQTVDAIVKASDKPLAIVILGVGDADFEAMEVLDGD